MPPAPRVTLRFSATPGLVELRELTGRDEVSVESTGTPDAVRLLDGLLLASPLPAARLAAPDRDRLLAALYRMTFGARIATTLTCARCAQRYDLDFSLDRLAAAVDDNIRPAARELDGGFLSADGVRFRYPTADDELAAAAAGSIPGARAELARRCAAEPAPTPDVLFAAMAAAAPLHDLELEARCPECEAVDALRFDVQHYLLASLMADRPRLLRDLHRLALAYGWPLRDILGLPRSHRRRLVELVEQEAA